MVQYLELNVHQQIRQMSKNQEIFDKRESQIVEQILKHNIIKVKLTIR